MENEKNYEGVSLKNSDVKFACDVSVQDAEYITLEENRVTPPTWSTKEVTAGNVTVSNDILLQGTIPGPLSPLPYPAPTREVSYSDNEIEGQFPSVKCLSQLYSVEKRIGGSGFGAVYQAAFYD